MSEESMRIRRRQSVMLRMAAVALILLPLGCGQEPGAEPSAAGGRAQGEAPLNVLLITMDTTRADALGCYGQRIETTPNIDRLAAEGTLFEQVVASAPNTLPSHSSILTGKEPYAHGTRSNFGYVLSEGNVTLAEVLRSRGYRTAAEIAAPVIGRRTKIDQGFDHYRDLDSFDVRRKVVSFREGSGPEQVEMPEREAGDITRRGLEFLRAHRDQTFFLWLHYFDAHQIHRPPESFRRLRPDSPYHAEVMYVDYNVGQIASELTRLGLRAKTLLVLTSDHGEGLGEHGEGTHSFFVYDTTMRVPLIFWGPELVPRGRRHPSLVRTVDIAPTILDLLDLPALSGVQGVSLRPLMTGSSQDLELTGYGESIEARASFGTSILRFIREGRWKYIHKVNPQLFDVLVDPGELRDLASGRADIAERLRTRLYQLIAEAPAKPVGAEVPLDAETLSQLMALGYVGPSSAPEIDDEAAELELMGSDPTTMIGEIALLAEAQGKLKKKDYQKAAEMFGDLWRKYPDSASLLKHLIDALSALERYDEAIPLLRRAIELDPGFLSHYTLLAAMVREKGDVEEAERLLQIAVEMDPCASPPRVKYANLLASLERYAQQLQLLETGVEQCPDSQEFLNDYAYALATCPEDALRDGAKALRIAQRLVAEARVANPAYLDTLAAAYAEVGEFGKAVETSRKALALLQNREISEEVIAAFQDNLELYQAGRPVRAQPQSE
jgi:arylsulfatase A-like enzyme/Flp pilus assembly protein TadD